MKKICGSQLSDIADNRKMIKIAVLCDGLLLSIAKKSLKYPTKKTMKQHFGSTWKVTLRMMCAAKSYKIISDRGLFVSENFMAYIE